MTYCYNPKINNILQIKWFSNKLNWWNEWLAIKDFDKSILLKNSSSVQEFINRNCFDIYLPKKETYYLWKILSMIWITNKYVNYNDEKRYWCQNKELNNKSRSLFKEMYPEYMEAYGNLKTNKDEKYFYWNHRHMYIMKKEMFLKYAKRLFDYLFAVEKILISDKCNTNNDWNWDSRFLWIFSEMLINYFVAYERQKGKTVSNDANVLFFN